MNHLGNRDKYILLDNLFNLYLHSKFDAEDAAILKEEGIDIDSLVQKNFMLFRQLRTKTKAELNESKHSRVKEFLYKLKSGLASGNNDFKRLSEEILAGANFSELQPMFRNLKEISEKDKISIIHDAKLLDMIIEIEERFNKQIDE